MMVIATDSILFLMWREFLCDAGPLGRETLQGVLRAGEI